MTNKIGFMQGRLCPQVGSFIQAFPWNDWESEFAIAESLDLRLMEWTLDHDRLYKNPLMTIDGRAAIKRLCKRYQLVIPSLTGDCFMQSPFWKANGIDREALKDDFIAILRACAAVGIQMVVVPLVDGGRLENVNQENDLLNFALAHADLCRELSLRIIFESDFTPGELARFIGRLPSDVFGVNYDIGNSAALGYNPQEEFSAYGRRIINVHIKDRLLGGTTVPLGSGAADFSTVFRLLRQINYNGNFILQTARAQDGDHSGVLRKYIVQIDSWLKGF